ncbi:MAG: hypothetical protein KJP25_03815 [Gammaproteobacteria bacterium]|nr:hypothetical protein [Gammaproteobacteria bacterium]RZV59540.1 MAG: hypothetical protein EX270_01440 [Pseudomonadales bacterium]
MFNISRHTKTNTLAHALLARSVAKALLLCACVVSLAACTGGTGSADGKSITGTDLTIETASLEVPIFYVKRPVPSQAVDMETPYAFNPGAQLYARVSASAAAVETNITARIHGDNATYDVKNLEMSPDGTRLLFAMHPPEANPNNPTGFWSIWEYNMITDALRKVIADDFILSKGDAHDFDASYLPLPDPNNSTELAIVVSSTRQSTNRTLLVDELKSSYSGMEEDTARSERDLTDGGRLAASLHVYDESIADVADRMRQITFNQSHDIDPLVLPTGEIIYNRWDNINNRNAYSLYRITPDGTRNELMYGYHSHASSGSAGGEGIVTDMQVVENGLLLGILRERSLATNVLGGAIVKLDIDNYIDRDTPTAQNTGLINPAFETISASDVFTDPRLSRGGRFSSVKLLKDGSGRMLVSWTPCLTNVSSVIRPCTDSATLDQAEPIYGIWLFDNTSNENIIQPILPGDAGQMITDVVVAEAREALEVIDPEPLLLADSMGNERAVLNIRSIYDIDGADTASGGILRLADPGQTDPAAISRKFLRLVKAVSIPDESVHRFNGSAFGVSSAQLMREIVGYLPIEPDGSVRGVVPANIPLMLDIVDANGKRIGGRHQNWLQLGPNEVFECRGCHTSGSTEPHGRIDAQSDSAHPGAPIPGVYPNTIQNLGEVGLTMAESYARFIMTDPAPEPKERQPISDISYVDEWTDDSGSLSKAPSFTVSYDSLNTPNPENPFCKPAWSSLCRIIFNYETHIQPLWELPRTPVDDGSGNMVDTCVGCHTTNNLTRIPAGQLELGQQPRTNNHFKSYRELLRGDAQQALNNGVVDNRLWLCDNDEYDEDDNLIQFLRTPRGIGPTMNESGSRTGTSTRFFNCLNNDVCRKHIGEPIPDNCEEVGGDPLTDEPDIDHSGMLSPAELRLLAEWLDLGAQYYNNPLDAPN